MSRIITEYIECNFSKRQSSCTFKVKVGDHMIAQFTQFKYLGFIVQNDEEIITDVNHHIQVGWLKSRKISDV
jgi:imidazoleglycerol phosphate dehydratase HisB